MNDLPLRRATKVMDVGEEAVDVATGQRYRGDGTTAGGVLYTDAAGSPSTVADPVFSPDGHAGYNRELTISLSCATSGAQIRYLRSGGAPSDRYGTLYTGPFTITGTETIQAVAHKPGMVTSSVVSKTFTKHAIPVEIYPSSLEVFEGQDATIRVVTSGAPTYQWQSSDDDGATWGDASGTIDGATYTVSATVRGTHDGLQYRCLVNGLPTDACTLSVWSPAALTPYLWVNDSSAKYQEVAAPFQTPAVDDGVVGAWYDISGNDRHLVAGSEGVRPTLLEDELNGRDVISFGGAHGMRHAVPADWTFLHNGTTYLVGLVAKAGTTADPNALQCYYATRSSGTANSGTFLAHDSRDGTANNRVLHSVFNITGTPASSVSHGTGDTTCTANAQHVIMLSCDPDAEAGPARSRVWIDGSSAYSYNASVAAVDAVLPFSGLRIGSGITTAGVAEFFLTGTISEVVVVSGAVSDENRLKLRDWLAYRWGLTLAARAEVGVASSSASRRNLGSGLTVSHDTPTPANNPIFDNIDDPLDPGNDLFFASVVHDGSQFICYYKSSNFSNDNYICRIISPDGLNWVAQEVGLVSVGGSTENNVVLRLTGAMFVFPTRVDGKWVAVADDYQGSTASILIYESTDGLTWTQVDDESSLPGVYAEGRAPLRFEDGRWGMSYILGHSTDDREIGLILGPAGGAYTGTFTNLGPTVLSGAVTDQKYNHAFERHGRGWLMVSASYDSNTGLTEGDLYWIEDLGSQTKLVDGAFPRGASGTWNDEWVSPSSVITVGNTTYIFGFAGAEDHAATPPRYTKLCRWQIGKRRWSQITGSGEMETPAFRANAAGLEVNCQAFGGRVRVEVIDAATGDVMSGYGRNDSTTIAEDTYAGAVTWTGGALPTDREIRLRFVLQDATLYSWTAGTE